MGHCNRYTCGSPDLTSCTHLLQIFVKAAADLFSAPLFQNLTLKLLGGSVGAGVRASFKLERSEFPTYWKGCSKKTKKIGGNTGTSETRKGASRNRSCRRPELERGKDGSLLLMQTLIRVMRSFGTGADGEKPWRRF